jgi:hypothetical protein
MSSSLGSPTAVPWALINLHFSGAVYPIPNNNHSSLKLMDAVIKNN